MEKHIKHTYFYQQAPSVVWKYLTDSDLLKEWLMENDFEPQVGHKFKFITYPKVKFGFDGIIYAEVLEVVEEKRLSYTWRGGPGNGKINLDSVVIWTLVEKNGGTELTLEHRGFKGLRNYLPYFIMNKGWEKIVKKKLVKEISQYGKV